MTRNNKRVLYRSRGKTPLFPSSLSSLLYVLSKAAVSGGFRHFWAFLDGVQLLRKADGGRECNKGKEARERGAGFGCILQFLGLGVRWKYWTKVKLYGASHVQRRITGIGDNDGSIDGFHDGRTASASCGRCRAKTILPITRAWRASSARIGAVSPWRSSQTRSTATSAGTTRRG